MNNSGASHKTSHGDETDVNDLTAILKNIELSSGHQERAVSRAISSPKEIILDTTILGLSSDPNMTSIMEYKCVDKGSLQFLQIKSLFPSTIGILEIQEILNPFSKLSFQLKQYFAYPDVYPKQLFHGTKCKHVDSICTNNFNWRLFGRERGHRFGQGVNFTPKPHFALYFCDKFSRRRVMILTDVLINKKCSGTPHFNVPPEGYDTTVRSDITFVKFCDAEFCPRYVIYVS